MNGIRYIFEVLIDDMGIYNSYEKYLNFIILLSSLQNISTHGTGLNDGDIVL